MDINRKYFLVTSHGRTATYWLSSVLNAHKDIQCSHGAILPPVLEYSNQPPDEVALYAHKTQDEFVKKTLDEVFDELEKATNKRVVGNVHAYAAHHLTSRTHLADYKRHIVVINLIRHPVARIESLARRVVYEANFSSFSKMLLSDVFTSYVPPKLLEYLVDRFGIDIENPETRAFLYAAFFIPCIDSMDFETSFQHVPMERLTRDVEFFAWFVSYISQGAAKITSDYLDMVMKTGRMNHQTKEKPAVKLFEQWPLWKQATISSIASAYDFRNMYAEIGYDFGFLAGKHIPDEYMSSVSIKKTIPVLIESYKQFNIIQYGKAFFAFAQSIGPFDITKLGMDAIDEYCMKGLCFKAVSAQESKQMIDSSAV